jgi:G3E family GTPase
VNDWLSDLLQEQSEDIYRMKGVLAIEGNEERFVFQVRSNSCRAESSLLLFPV